MNESLPISPVVGNLGCFHFLPDYRKCCSYLVISLGYTNKAELLSQSCQQRNTYGAPRAITVLKLLMYMNLFNHASTPWGRCCSFLSYGAIFKSFQR